MESLVCELYEAVGRAELCTRERCGFWSTASGCMIESLDPVPPELVSPLLVLRGELEQERELTAERVRAGLFYDG